MLKLTHPIRLATDKTQSSESLNNFRVHGKATTSFNFAGVIVTCEMEGGKNEFTIEEEGGEKKTVKYEYDCEAQELSAWVGGQRFAATAVVTKEVNGDQNVSLWNSEAGKTFDGKEEYYASITVEKENFVGGAAGGGSGNVMSPMPGKVAHLQVQQGTAVEAGDLVMVLEAMKMEHPIVAPIKGVVGEFGGGVGDLMQDGQLLFKVEAEEEK